MLQSRPITAACALMPGKDRSRSVVRFWPGAATPKRVARSPLCWFTYSRRAGSRAGSRQAGGRVGTNASLIVYTDGDPHQILRSAPALDRPAARDLVGRLFPEHAIQETSDADLWDVLAPDLGRAHAGCYP